MNDEFLITPYQLLRLLRICRREPELVRWWEQIKPYWVQTESGEGHINAAMPLHLAAKLYYEISREFNVGTYYYEGTARIIKNDMVEWNIEPY